MPYQNLDSEIMFAVSLWVLAIFIFVTMLVVAFVEVMAENRAKKTLKKKTSATRWDTLFNTAVSLFQRIKGS